MRDEAKSISKLIKGQEHFKNAGFSWGLEAIKKFPVRKLIEWQGQTYIYKVQRWEYCKVVNLEVDMAIQVKRNSNLFWREEVGKK